MKITKITKLPEFLKALRNDLTRLQKDAARINYVAEESSRETKVLKEYIQTIETRVESLDQRNSELEHMISVTVQQAATKAAPAVKNSSSDKQRFADNHLLDKFYLELENNLRGTEDDVKQKQLTHIKLFKDTGLDHQKYPVIDIGSGRGEFLEVLKDNKIRAIGVDLNETMVKRAQEKGHESVYADAIEYLSNAKSNSLGGVVGFHIAEHIPFEQLITLVTEARRALVKGGFLLLETPNPESLSVGAFTFHYDPSHLKPLPPALMEFLARFRGFEHTEILRLQPEMTEAEIKKAAKGDEKLAIVYQRVFGPRDYALVAYK